jgi:hypothetical protein
MTDDYIIFARKMLDTNTLPLELENRLEKINQFVKIANDNSEHHMLRSSQIVAMVVEQWIREQENLGHLYNSNKINEI